MSSSSAIEAAMSQGRVRVINVADSAFALEDTDEARAMLAREYEEAEQRESARPAIITWLMLRLAARRSALLRALVSHEQNYLDGLSTYLMKLGPDNLPDFCNSEIDRQLCSTPHVKAMRVRLQQMAHMMAEALELGLTTSPRVPLVLINLGGGTAMDSLNALVLLAAQRQVLERPISVHVLDSDTVGPSFGADALAALCAEGGPLSGIAAEFHHHPFDWDSDPIPEGLIPNVGEGRTILGASSEGGLFEYGSDDAIVSNLQALRDGVRGVRFIVGSVTRADDIRMRTIARTGFGLIARGLDGFAPLARRGGFTIAASRPTPISDQVLLTPI